jgi:hypothetical protein
MAKETVGLEIKVTGNATQSVKSFRDEILAAKKDMDDAVKKFGELSPEAVEAAQKVKLLGDQFTPLRAQLREANNNLQLIVEKFGVGSKEAAAAARQVANLKDTIGDAKALTDAFNPDRKFAALSGVISGVAGGFAALQGAIGLTGAKSEELEEQLLKVQSALALSQGINSVLEMKDSFIVLTNVIKTSAIGAFTALRTAIGLTGIGALLLAVGVLAANFDKVKKSVLDTFPALGNMRGLLNELMQVIRGVGNAAKNFLVAPFKAIGQAIKGDFAGALETLKSGVDVAANYHKGKQDEITRQANNAQQERLADLIASQERELEVLRARGRSTIALERQILNEKLQLYKDDAEKYAEVLQQKRVFEAGAAKQAEDDARKRREKAAADAKKEEEMEKLEQAKRDALFKAGYLDNDMSEKLDQQRDELFQKRLDDADRTVKATITTQQQRTAAEEAGSKTRAELARIEADGKIALADTIAAVSNAAADLVGRNTAVGKGLAIATTTIDTYLSAQKAYASQLIPGDPSSPIRAALAAGAAVISGLARVKAILAVKVPQQASGGASTPSIQGNAGAPMPSSFTQAQSVQLDSGSLNQLGNRATVRAYVVDRDIRDQDTRNRRIERASVLGG